MSRILITGASGRLGRAAVHALRALSPADELLGLARSDAAAAALSAEGIDVRRGDYDDPTSLPAAFADVDRLLFVSSPLLDPARRVAQHRAVVEAAAGIPHLVYTSAVGAEHDPGHATTEHLLAGRPQGATVLRNCLYTEPFLVRALAEEESGVITSASGGRRLATASIADLGEAAARALLDPPPERLIELRGPAWSYDELADALTVRQGAIISHREVPAGETGAFAPLFPLVAAGLWEREGPELAELLGRAPRGFARVLDELPGLTPRRRG